MVATNERQLNHSGYRRMCDSIKQNYPLGSYVAISGGQIVGNAGTFYDLQSLLKSQGKDPNQVLIVQAGFDYPENAVIFAQA